MIYLGWFDDNTKKKTLTKIDEAIERYEYKYGVVPNVCLVSEGEMIEHPRVAVRSVRHLRPNYFYIGYEESVSSPAPFASAIMPEVKAA